MRGRYVLRLLIVAAACCAGLAPAPAGGAALQFPKPTGYVGDFAGLLDSQARASLEQRLADYDRTTGNQIAIALFADLGGVPINEFASRLEEAWKVGRRGKDNGLLLLVGAKEHEVRIEVGYGLEGKVTDADAGSIIRNVIAPAFRQGRYAEGLNGAVTELIRLIGGGSAGAPPPAGPRAAAPWWLPLAFFLGLAALASVASRVSGRRCPRCRARMRLQAGQAAGVGGHTVSVWVCPRCGYREQVVQQAASWIPTPMWYGGGWGSGGFSGGGGSGGFGGFGGGSSGGGGASGSW